MARGLPETRARRSLAPLTVARPAGHHKGVTHYPPPPPPEIDHRFGYLIEGTNRVSRQQCKLTNREGEGGNISGFLFLFGLPKVYANRREAGGLTVVLGWWRVGVEEY